jgi:predicted  nucleic acid-binding Zn-ribbon protein
MRILSEPSPALRKCAACGELFTPFKQRRLCPDCGRSPSQREALRVRDREDALHLTARGAFQAGQPKGGRRDSAASAADREWHFKPQRAHQ